MGAKGRSRPESNRGRPDRLCSLCEQEESEPEVMTATLRNQRRKSHFDEAESTLIVIVPFTTSRRWLRKVTNDLPNTVEAVEYSRTVCFFERQAPNNAAEDMCASTSISMPGKFDAVQLKPQAWLQPRSSAAQDRAKKKILNIDQDDGIDLSRLKSCRVSERTTSISTLIHKEDRRPGRERHMTVLRAKF